jgi:hypothetical protein
MTEPFTIEPHWDGAQAVEEYRKYLLANAEETPLSIGERRLDYLFPLAVQSIGQLAIYASDDKTRLNAAKYVMETRIQLAHMKAQSAPSPIETFISHVNDIANEIGKSDD